MKIMEQNLVIDDNCSSDEDSQGVPGMGAWEKCSICGQKGRMYHNSVGYVCFMCENPQCNTNGENHGPV